MYEIEAVKIYIKDNTVMNVLFSDNITKQIDFKFLCKKYPIYESLLNNALFKKAKLKSNYFIIWNDNIDILADTFYANGIVVENENDSLLAMLGYRIKKARLEKNISQCKLSKLTSIDQGDISKIENGKMNMSILYLKKISNILGKNLTITLE